jgi:thioesterase domain-containing protein
VAFEMGQQLHAKGEKIALLTLIDSPGPGQLSINVADDVKIIAYALGLGLNPNLPISSEQFNRLEPEEQARYFFEHSEMVSRVYPETVISHIRHFLHLLKVNNQAMNNYVPKTYPGRILFFRARDNDGVMPRNPERSWSDLATGGMDIHEIPGDHVSMNLAPHVEVMAKLLGQKISEVQRITGEE